YAEVVKYGLIDDPDFFDWCEANGTKLLDGDFEAAAYAVEHCLKSKARLIGDDLRDLSGKRALLNLGHTFGHAIEGLRDCR
ncbi:3-dehydroquinate synthase, partial [Acinetobacter baumannii]